MNPESAKGCPHFVAPNSFEGLFAAHRFQFGHRATIDHIIVIALLMFACFSELAVAGTDAQATIAVPVGLRLAFDDEFSGTSVDASVWHVNNHPASWPGEKQFYSRDDVTVQQGFLRITSERRDYMSHYYVSGGVKCLKPFLYGRYEIRARMPETDGLWAIDQLVTASGGSPFNSLSFQYFGASPRHVQIGDIWFGDDGKQHQSVKNWSDPNFDAAAWHVYEIDWEAGSVNWYVDGALLATQTQNVPDFPLTPQLCVPIGPSFAGNVDMGVFPQHYDISYVRIYRRAGQPQDAK